MVHGLNDAPEHLLTKEFFSQVKRALTPRGVMILNHMASPLSEDNFARQLDNTIRRVFPHANRLTLYDFNSWRMAPPEDQNVLYIARNGGPDDKEQIYTDNLDRAAFDKNQEVPY